MKAQVNFDSLGGGEMTLYKHTVTVSKALNTPVTATVIGNVKFALMQGTTNGTKICNLFCSDTEHGYYAHDSLFLQYNSNMSMSQSGDTLTANLTTNNAFNVEIIYWSDTE